MPTRSRVAGCVMLAFLSSAPAVAAPWSRGFGTTRGDDARGVAALPDGSVAVVAEAVDDPSSADTADALVVQIDGAGVPLWGRQYGGAMADEPRAIVARPDGTLVVVGHTQSWGRGARDLWAFGLLPGGAVAWENVVGHATEDEVYSAVALADDRVVAVGDCARPGGGPFLDGWLVSFDAGGRPTEQTFASIGSVRLWEIAERLDAPGLLLGGESDSGDGRVLNTFARLDAAGDIEWQVQLVEPAFRMLAVGATADGGLLATGAMMENTSQNDVVVVRLDGLGQVLWASRIVSPTDDQRGEYERGIAVFEQPDGGVVVAVAAVRVFESVAWLVELDLDGSLVRQARLASRAGEILTAARQAPDGTIALAGNVARTAGEPSADSWVARVEDDWTLPGCGMEPLSAVSVSRLPSSARPAALERARPFGQNARTAAVMTDVVVEPVPICSEPCGATLPVEVSGPPWTQPLLIERGGVLAWQDARQWCETYGVHRGFVESLGSGDRGQCIASGLTVATLRDDELPGAGRAFFYLVTALIDVAEGPLGTDSFGVARVNRTPCR